jgi:hypothetical protein
MATAADYTLSGNIPSWEKHFYCDQCGRPLKESKLVKFRGKLYGVPCGCYKDIPRLRKNSLG